MACITKASASLRRPAPSARATAEEIPPPTAPAESICISMKPGKTSAIPASASVPSRETNQVSISPLAAWATITRIFGHAMRRSVGAMRPSSIARVCELIAFLAIAAVAAARGRTMAEGGPFICQIAWLPGLAVRAQLDVERPRAAVLVCHVPDLIGNGGGLDEEVVRLILVALARPGDVDHRIDHQVGDVHALGSQVARHGLGENALRGLRRREAGKARTAT